MGVYLTGLCIYLIYNLPFSQKLGSKVFYSLKHLEGQTFCPPTIWPWPTITACSFPLLAHEPACYAPM